MFIPNTVLKAIFFLSFISILMWSALHTNLPIFSVLSHGDGQNNKREKMAWRCSGNSNRELVAKLAKSGIITNASVRHAMEKTDRALYCIEEFKRQSYDDRFVVEYTSRIDRNKSSTHWTDCHNFSSSHGT